MKLAFCLFNYFKFGGLQRDFLQIARLCHERGHEIHVYTMRWEGEPEANFHLHLLESKGFTNHARARAFAKQVEKELIAIRYDLVIGFNKMPCLDVYYAADVCYQARVHTDRPAIYRLLPRYQQLAEMEKAVFAAENKTQILLIAAGQQKEFQQYYKTETERFHLLPPGIAKDRKAPTNASEIRARIRQQFKVMDDQFLILMVGSSFKTKGVDRAIKALAALPASLQARCRLFVMGEGNNKPFVQLAKEEKVADNVHFLGGRTDVPAFLLAADLLLHPSYHENTGTVLLEAMIAGLPVLTVDVCGYAHYVEEAKAGRVLSSPYDQLALNAALEDMLLSPERQVWQQNGLQFAESADIYSMAEKAVGIIEQLGKTRATIPR